MKIPCRPGKIAQAPTNRMNFIKDDSYNILASLTATFRYTCNGNYSKTEFHDFLHPSPSRFSLLKVLKSDKLIRFTPCYYVSRAKRFSASIRLLARELLKFHYYVFAIQVNVDPSASVEQIRVSHNNHFRYCYRILKRFNFFLLDLSE